MVEGREIVAGGGRGDRCADPARRDGVDAATKQVVEAGDGGKDFSVVFRWLAEQQRRKQPAKRAMAADAFKAARDFLLAHRTDYATAYRDFRWPDLDHFNWALDWFDGELARGDTAHQPALTSSATAPPGQHSPNCPNVRIASPTVCALSASTAATASC